MLRSIYCVKLSEAGFIVTACPDGICAKEHLSGKDYDLVVSDVSMPRLDGFELYLWLQQTKPRQRIGFVTSSPKPHGLECDFYLSKPVSAGELIDRIKSVFASP